MGKTDSVQVAQGLRRHRGRAGSGTECRDAQRLLGEVGNDADKVVLAIPAEQGLGDLSEPPPPE